MITVPFDVNDSKIRRDFLEHEMFQAMSQLDENTQPLWGKMTPQHVVEHLVWAFECSAGKVEVKNSVPQSLFERMKRFLYDNRPTPHEFKNPMLGEEPPNFRFASLSEAKIALQHSVEEFYQDLKEKPLTVYLHPIFGLLALEEWERSHYKHCYHHLQQFGLVV